MDVHSGKAKMETFLLCHLVCCEEYRKEFQEKCATIIKPNMGSWKWQKLNASQW
jgi:hypothetical protein